MSLQKKTSKFHFVHSVSNVQTNTYSFTLAFTVTLSANISIQNALEYMVSH